MHDHAYDGIASILVSGNQDNGTTQQDRAGRHRWQLTAGGDGGDVAVDDVTLADSGRSIRYSTFGASLTATIWNQDNARVGRLQPRLAVLNGGAEIVPSSATPIELNAVDPARLLIGGRNSLYESLDQGNTVTEIGPGVAVASLGTGPMAYGTAENPDVIYAGNRVTVVVRTGPPGSPVEATGFPNQHQSVEDIVIDPDDFRTAYVITLACVYQTTDAGATWRQITSRLPEKARFPMRSVTYVPRKVAGGRTQDLLVVGAADGVYGATEGQGFTDWRRLGRGMPSVPVFDLDYDPATMTLSAGTLGRGTFTANDIVFNQVVRPIVDCVDDNGDGNYTAHFGYENKNDVVLTVPIGVANRFLTGRPDQGQVTTFLPGRQAGAFTVDFRSARLVWSLDGRNVTALRSSNRCR